MNLIHGCTVWKERYVFFPCRIHCYNAIFPFLVDPEGVLLRLHFKKCNGTKLKQKKRTEKERNSCIWLIYLLHHHVYITWINQQIPKLFISTLPLSPHPPPIEQYTMTKNNETGFLDQWAVILFDSFWNRGRDVLWN